MKVSLTVRKNGEIRQIPLFNSFSFDERIDEELDGGAAETFSSNSEELCDYDDAFIVLSDESGSRTISFFAFDDVTKKAKNYYNRQRASGGPCSSFHT